MSATPILDRREPLPRRARAGTGIAGPLLVALVGLAVLAVALWLRHPTDFGAWCRARLFLYVPAGQPPATALARLLLPFLALFGMVAVHELGHLVAGLGVGYRWRSLRVGPLLLRRPFKASLSWSPSTLASGVAELVAPAAGLGRGRTAAMVGAGVFANVASAAVVWLLRSEPGLASDVFIVGSLLMVNDFVPYEGRVGVSDGARLLMLWRNDARGRRYLALQRLGGCADLGTLPEAMPPESIADAIAVDDDSVDTVAAQHLAHATRFHERRDAEAAVALETALRRARRASPPHRLVLVSDAGVFQARRRGRVDLADGWLGELPASVAPWLRERVQAAIDEARGDLRSARRRLEAREHEVRLLPESPLREMLLTLTRRWRAEL